MKCARFRAQNIPVPKSEKRFRKNTLIYNSYGLAITSHSSFESIDSIVSENREMVSQKYIVENMSKRHLVSDTDNGKKLLSSVDELKKLMFLYESGVIPEKHIEK